MHNGHGYLPCPSCGASLRTAAEIASHVCPGALGPDPTPQGVKLAERLEQTRAAQRRDSRQPTLPELSKDCAKIAEVVHSQWDQEVEVMILLTPKGSEEASIAWTGSIGKERALRLLQKFKKRVENPRSLPVPVPEERN